MKPQQPLDVSTYYDHTRFDYRMMWSRRSRAIHFGYYDEHADKHADALPNLNRVLAELAAIQPGEKVLDAGCGWGSACFWLAQHKQAQVTGINIVANHIRACQRYAEKKHISNVQFIQADYCQAPFEDASFDVVWACESLCHTERKADFYREVYRLLKPGGRLVIAEYIRTARPVTPTGEMLLAAWLRPWAIPDLDTEAEHRAHAQSAGFATFQARDVTANMRVSLRNLYELSIKWLPVGKFLHRFRIVDDVRLNNAIASIRQYEALQEGAWQYSLFLATKSPAPEIPERDA